MAVTVQSLLDQIALDLLEPQPNPFGTGIVTQAEVLDLIGQVFMDFLQQTALYWTVFSQQINSGTARYSVPDTQTRVFHAFTNAALLEQVDVYSEYYRRKAASGTPVAYHEDGLPIKTVELLPAPSWTGTGFAGGYTQTNPSLTGSFGTFQPGFRNLSLVGGTLASKETWLAGDTLDTIPDSFTPYLTYGVLARIFGTESEAKDMARAQYCQSRFEEGVQIAQAIWMSLVEGPQAA